MDNEYITFTANGVTCKYHKGNLNNPQSMGYLAKELQEFVDFFSDPNPEVSWSEVHDDPNRDVFDFFQGMHHISNDWADMVEEILVIESNEGTTFEQACKRAHESLGDD